MNARHSMLRTALVALTLAALPLALTACGNKGPLFLPPKSVPVDNMAIPPAAAPAQDQSTPTETTQPTDTESKDPATTPQEKGDATEPTPHDDGTHG